MRRKSSRKPDVSSPAVPEGTMRIKKWPPRWVPRWVLWSIVVLVAVQFLLGFVVVFYSPPDPGVTDKCVLEEKDVLSCLKRVKTQNCRNLIEEIACREKAGLLYPERLPNTCPTGDNVDAAALDVTGGYMGCYRDRFNQRMLSGNFIVLKNENTRRRCFDICKNSGFGFAGVQYGHECFCGDQEPDSDLKIAEEKCNKSCPGDELQSCGGYLTMNVFKTGITPFRPQPTNQPERNKGEVRIIYLLTVNGRSHRQVKRLIKRLYNGLNYFYIHVDSRQDFLYRELKPLAEMFPEKIYVTPKRMATIWGGASLLKMLLSCFKDIVMNMKWDWDFVLNLSESDYILKHPDRLVEFLAANRGRNFVKSHGRETRVFIQKQGLDRTFVECENRMWRVGRRTLPLGIQYDGGSDWICLNKEFVGFMVHEQDTDPLLKGLQSVFNHSLLAAESFFHTSLRNSKYCHTYVNNHLKFINWKRNLGCKCQHKKVADWCGCSPNVLTPKDWKRIVGTREREVFFSRKFEPVISQEILDLIDKWIYDQPVDEEKGYWNNIYHYADLSPKADVATIGLGQILGGNLTNESPKVLQIHTHHHDDELKGVLVHLRLESGQELEVYHDINPNRGWLAERNAEFLVGSHFDPKELIFRNFLHVFGQKSELQIMYNLDEAAEGEGNFTVRALWTDPSRTPRILQNLKISNKTKVINVLPVPSIANYGPGWWTVFIFHGQELKILTKVRFYVLNIDDSTTRCENQEIDAEMTALTKEAMDNSEIYNTDVQWFNYLYKHKGTCSISHHPDYPLCSETSWSSMYPDPKSSITSFDEQSGKLI